MVQADRPGHVVLLGDLTFDNGAYVSGSPDVIAQLRSRFPRDWKASLLAVDRATVFGVERQLGGLPPDATHLVVSAGGNDALGASSVVGGRVVHVLAEGDGFKNLSSREPKPRTN